MNALAEDQLGRLRELLAGSGIPFGMYIGKTPESESDVTGVAAPIDCSRFDRKAVAEADLIETFFMKRELVSLHSATLPSALPPRLGLH